MTTRNLLNLALLIIVLALIALVVFEPGKDKPITPPTLTNLQASEITHININRRDDKTDITFEKTAEGWMMLKPHQQPANSFRIDAILKLLSAVSFSQNSLTNLKQSEFGLEQPLATITFNNQTSIVFGHNKSLKHHRYVKIGSTLHMVADTFYYQLAAKSESFIDHKLLPDKSKIIALTLPTLKVEQLDGKWTHSPKTDKFSADSINQLISEWQLSQAYDIEVSKPQPNIKADIILSLVGGKNIRYKIKDQKDNLTLTNIDSGVRYILSSDRKDKLLKLSAIEQDDKN